MIKVKAYAKVNLILQVLNKRDDGYHDVETILQNVDLADTLSFEEAEGLSLAANAKIKPEDNLVLKAANLLKSYVKTNKGAIISLTKNIPISAGLGGGSSDAAATLLSLKELWQLDITDQELFTLGAQLGADVNFFLKGGQALATGCGEKIQPILPIFEAKLVIAKPAFGISAKEAYEYWDQQPESKSLNIQSITDKIKIEPIKTQQLFNDLEKPVLDNYPQLDELFKIGYKAGADLVMLSGSGSAFFALVKNEEIQEKVFEAWQQQQLTVYKVKTTDRSIEKIES